MQFTLRGSSRDRFWTGFDVSIFDTSGGLAESPLFTRHNVSMTTGKPVMATCRCDSRGQRRLQTAGDIDIIPIGYSGAWQDDGPTTMVSVNLTSSLMQTAAEGMGIDIDNAPVEPQIQLRDPQLEHIIWALKAELETDEPLGRLYAESLGLALGAHILRRYAPIVPPHPRSGLTKRRLARVIEYIHEHLARELSLSELAAVAAMSPSHFKSLFKQSVGMPVHQFVIERRVERATALLLRGTLPPSEVALQAGFANQSHMARRMRRVTGMTPSEIMRDVS